MAPVTPGTKRMMPVRMPAAAISPCRDRFHRLNRHRQAVEEAGADERRSEA
jgi:hypothetical protein